MANLDLTIPTIKLPDGSDMPMLGFGTGSLWAKSSAGKTNLELVEAIKMAISLGYYQLDCGASYYTEGEVGKAIKDCGIPRESLFITSKCPSTNVDPVEHLEESLKNLGLAYLDLYCLEQPWDANGDKTILQKAWSRMEATQASGKARSIGVSNFYREHLDAVLEIAQARPAVNQIEFHPYLQLEELVAFHKNKDIRIQGYSTLTPYLKANGPLTPLLEQLARKYAVSPIEILLRWVLDQNVMAVTTSSKKMRLSDMLRALTFKMTPKEVETITETGKDFHYRAWWREHLE